MIGALFGKFIATKLGQMLPPWFWEIVFIVAAAGTLALIHHGLVVHHDNHVRAEQKQADEKAYAAAAQKIDKQASDISSKVRSLNDEQNSRIRVVAHDVFVRGPGRAACLSTSASGPIPASGTGTAPVAQLPDPTGIDLIAVPFNGAVAGAEQADLNRAEVLSWRDWYQQQLKAWQKKP